MTQRIALAPSATRAAFQDAALAHGWRLRRVVDPGPETPYEEIWTLPDDGTAVHYIEDALIAVPYVLVMGERVGHVAAQISEALDVVSPAEAVRAVRESPTKPDRLRSIAYLAAASPQTADPDVLAAFEELLTDSDPEVRDAAIFGAVYTQWPEIDTLLQRAHETDPVPRIREAAGHALASIHRRRIGGRE
jgi:HEAT repeats